MCWALSSFFYYIFQNITNYSKIIPKYVEEGQTLRSEFYLEDPNQSPDQLEFEGKTSRWSSKLSTTFITLAIIIGGFAIVYLISQPKPTESVNQPSQKLVEPITESIPESMTESTTWESSEPLIVESNNEIPELIIETPPIDSNESKIPKLTEETQSPQPKPVPEKPTIHPEKQEQTHKKLSIEPKQESPKKTASLPFQEPTKQPPNSDKTPTTTPEPKQTEKKLSTTRKEEPSQSIGDRKDWSIQWIVPYNSTKVPIGQSKKPFQLDPYLLTKEGTLLSLVTKRNLDLHNNISELDKSKQETKSSTLIPLIQIESPTNLVTFVSQVHYVTKLIEESSVPEIHINLIVENSSQTNKDILILLISLIHQTTHKLEKKLILQRSTMQSNFSDVPLLQLVDGIQISIPATPENPVHQKPKNPNQLIPQITESIQSWSVGQELIISREQIPSIIALNQSQKNSSDSGLRNE